MIVGQLTGLAEQRVYARPTSEQEAKAALEWIAAREGKTLAQLVQELHAARPAAGAQQPAAGV